MENPEAQPTLGTRYRTKTNIAKNATHKTKKMSNTDPPKVNHIDWVFLLNVKLEVFQLYR